MRKERSRRISTTCSLCAVTPARLSRALLIVVLSIVSIARAFAATDDDITLNLNNADIGALISTVSKITGRNFVVDPRVKGKVTVISAAPTSRENLYEVFLSILKVHSFTAVDAGDVTKIIPDATAKQNGPPDVLSSAPVRSDKLVTAIVPLQHVTAAELVPVLRPLMPQEAHLAAYPPANALILADVAANVQRIMQLISKVDRAVVYAIELIQLQHAVAPDIVTTINALNGPGNSKRGGGRIIADERTNSVLIAGSAADKLRYRAIIDYLDVPARKFEWPIEVVYLSYASAEDLVPVLQAIGDSAPRAEGGSQQRSEARAVTSLSAGLHVQADNATNALIIQGAPELMVRVMKVIAQLDIRRAQVLVEAIVAEISSSKADELGVQWRTSTPTTDGVAAGAVFPGFESGALAPTDVQSSFPLLSGFTLGYFSGGDLRAVLRAISSDQSTNVLSTPTLVTLDNAEAEIVVGQNVPFVTGQFTNDATTPDRPFQTIERQDVGILLRVKPQINEGKTITIEIEQEVSNVDRSTAGSDLITNKRSITTTVLVDDAEIIVLGGLIEDDLRETEQKIPLLGDIPLLGHLFRNTRADHGKTNLMVFLRPTIIRDEETARKLTRNRFGDLQDKQVQQAAESDFFLRNDGFHLEELNLVD